MFVLQVLESPSKKPVHFIMLEAKSLSCRRSARLVFREIGFRLAPGSLLQITGANGSGKSSLLRALAGLLPFADGQLLWNGKPVQDDMDAHRQRVQYIGHLDALKPELTAAEMINYWQTLRPQSIAPKDDPYGIGAFLNKPVRYLSAGQKRRLTLSRLVLDDAPLWLLDEPTTALDNQGQDLLFQSIATHRAKGGIVIAAVHHLLNAHDVQTVEMKNKNIPSPLWEGLGRGEETQEECLQP